MLYRLSVDYSGFELLSNAAMDCITLRVKPKSYRQRLSKTGASWHQDGRGGAYEILDSALVRPKNHGSRIVGQFSLGFRVDSPEAELVPHCFHQLVDVPAMLRTDWYCIRDTVQQVKLLNADGVDLVEAVHDRDVAEKGSVSDSRRTRMAELTCGSWLQ